MIRRKLSTKPALLISLALAAGSAAAQNPSGRGFDDRLYITPMASYGISDSSRLLDDTVGGQLIIGKPISERLTLELQGWGLTADGENSGESATLTGYGASLLFHPNRARTPLFGLLSVSHGDASDHPSSGAGGLDYESTVIDLGLGATWPLFGQRIGQSMQLRAQAAYRYDAHFEQGLGEGQRDSFYEPVLGLGLQVALGRSPSRAAPVTPRPAVVPVVQTPAPPPQPMVVSATPEPASAPIILRGVNFELDSARLLPNAQLVLTQVSSTLASLPSLRFEIAGHTDSTASDAYNQALSERRAAAVRDFLSDRGVARSRMDVRGYGETRPIADNDTASGRAMNRRVELNLLSR